jgi:hypothetical protein
LLQSPKKLKPDAIRQNLLRKAMAQKGCSANDDESDSDITFMLYAWTCHSPTCESRVGHVKAGLALKLEKPLDRYLASYGHRSYFTVTFFSIIRLSSGMQNKSINWIDILQLKCL